MHDERFDTYSRVEHAARHSVKDPYVDGQCSSERRSNVQERKGEQRRVGVSRIVVVEGGLGADEGHEEEHEGSAEFAKDDDNLIADGFARGGVEAMHAGHFVVVCLCRE